MKKIISALLILVMIFCLSSCKGANPYKDITDEEIAEKVDEGKLGEFHCYYSVQNEDRKDDEFFVHLPDDVYDEEKDIFYDKDNDTVISFFGKKELYNAKTGELMSEDDLQFGQLLKVTYNCEVYGKNPIVIKAVKVLVCE